MMVHPIWNQKMCVRVLGGSHFIFGVKITGFDSPNHFKEAQVLIKKSKKNFR
jgi:hypothetical protein